MPRGPVSFFLLFSLFSAFPSGAVLSRDRISVVGSSTVFPFAAMVSERFGRSSPFKAPIVESNGTGGGVKLFCSGVGMGFPDVVNASRRIKKSELERCRAHGVSVMELEIGFDGIVIAASISGLKFNLTTRHLFQALAGRLPVDGRLVRNPHKRWSDIDPSLPSVAIELVGPSATSGTRDAFEERVMDRGALSFPFLQRLAVRDPSGFLAISRSFREDGAFIEAGENDNLVLQRLVFNPKMLGIIGFSFLRSNSDRIRGFVLEGVEPRFEDIASGKYVLARSLYLYVKEAHLGVIPGLGAYIEEFISERACGKEGYLIEKGLIPLPVHERSQMRARARKLTRAEGAS